MSVPKRSFVFTSKANINDVELAELTESEPLADTVPALTSKEGEGSDEKAARGVDRSATGTVKIASDQTKENEAESVGGGKLKSPAQRGMTQMYMHPHTRRIFRRRMPLKSIQKGMTYRDFHHDLVEKDEVVLTSEKGDKGEKDEDVVKVPSLRQCRRLLRNEELEAYQERTVRCDERIGNVFLNIIAAFYIYLVHTTGLETFLVLANALAVTMFFIYYADETAVKLDFSFLAFSVVFPLTFLIQSTFSRRDQALSRLADFKASVLSTVLTTLSVDWPKVGKAGALTGGRLDLPDDFNAIVVDDCTALVCLTYKYLSMPSVAHARNLVFRNKKLATERVHALQNDILKHINDIQVDIYQHTEVMRKAGFPSGEASRLHQYHQYLQQRFEQLRLFKYYRTPQATRSFGRVYIFILPWLSGPYYAWVYENTHLAIALVLAGFTYLILLGLLNAQQGLEDPFLVDYTSWTPGVDTVKLDYELAVVLQAINQYYAQAELMRFWESKEAKN